MTLTIVIDSREQQPYHFDLPTTVAGLKVGDYSLAGFEDRIAIERKTVDDLITCLSSGRDRFERELERGRDLDYFALVIEADLKSLAGGEYRSRMNPESVIQSLLTFSVRYRLPIFFVGDRQTGQRVTESLLSKYARETIRNRNLHWIDANDLLTKYEKSSWEHPTREEEKKAAQVTLEKLFKFEPRLKDLFEEAGAVRPNGPHFCANWVWVRRIKPKLLSLIGWNRGYDDPGADRLLTTSAAYDLAYDAIYNELPNCRNCGCLDLEDFSSSGELGSCSGQE